MYKKLSLNGKWQIEPGAEKPGTLNHHCVVPALVDVAKPQFNWQNFDYFWYRKKFQILKNYQFKKVILQLEQVKYGTEIWLNNQLVGNDIPCYTGQNFDLTDFIEKNGNNTLLVRVGVKNTLPKTSAVGNDFEKSTFIPGIWGDVWLHFYGSGKIEWTRVIPDIWSGTIHIHSEIKNLSNQNRKFKIKYEITEKKNGKIISELFIQSVIVSSDSNSSLETEIKIPEPHLWSPENPFLYLLNITLTDKNLITHYLQIPFGMRKFEIRDGHFYLNGSRKVLMGSNIAFHRMLSDDTRGTLPWNLNWVKKALINIPKSHHMDFFRIHLGHAYNRWYDIADEHGILLQDEWMFWTSTGSPEQIEKEFQAWIKENCNHPSIIIWDALNESTDSNITDKIIPRLKKLDPTRPWESVDFTEDHPYIYSLGPVLNKEKFGYSRSIFDLKKSKEPSVVNEYIWWWLNRNGEPTSLTKLVLERWLGRTPPKNNILQHQKFLVQELTELWRRLDIDAIMPFVYLSMGMGPTANWFFGSLKVLKPKPALEALKNAFSPVGVSIELWNRHFLSGDQQMVPIYIFNDGLSSKAVTLQVHIAEQSHILLCEKKIDIKAGVHQKILEKILFPQKAGDYYLIARLIFPDQKELVLSRKPIIVFNPAKVPKRKEIPNLTIYDHSGEIQRFLKKHKISFCDFPNGIDKSEVVLINGLGLNDDYRKSVPKLTKFVRSGGILILQEPELGVKQEALASLVNDVKLIMQYRKDPEKGGYDSYIFPDNNSHFLWRGLDSKYFKMFNGALGGEIVSQHFVRPTVPYYAVASGNIALSVPAIMEIPYGKGWIVISRIQIRGRLLPEESSSEIYGRRYDPVAEKYFWNLLTGYPGRTNYHKSIERKLSKIKMYISRILTSTKQVFDINDGKISSRWSYKEKKPQWICIDFGKMTSLKSINIQWEIAYHKTFKICKSIDNINWELIFEKEESTELGEEIILCIKKTRYVKIEYNQLGAAFTYSIQKMEFK